MNPSPSTSTVGPMWLNRLVRIRSVLRTLAADPHTQGRAAQVAGVALIADGLIGLENPLDGKKSRVGILGGVASIVVGLLFASVPSMFSDAKPYENGSTVIGTVVSTTESSSRGSNGNTTTVCSVVVEYEIAGQRYTKESTHASSSFCGSEGRPIEVSYLPERPADGRVIDDDMGWFLNIFRYTGLFIIATGVLVVVTRLFSIVAGVWLWLWGRSRKTRFPKTSDADWMHLLQGAWGAAPKLHSPQQPENLLESISGVLTGLPSQPPAPQPPQYTPPAPQPPPSQGPPAGWYPDPSAPSGKRWWTGSSWLDPS